MVTILTGIAVLGVLVFVHELGHYAGAKALGVRVLKFSLGFGPELLGFTARGTRYVIAAFPLGGFVKMAGDRPDATDREGGSDEFYSKPWWSRMIIAVLGMARTTGTSLPRWIEISRMPTPDTTDIMKCRSGTNSAPISLSTPLIC